MEVASGSMILHPVLANELRALLESSGFETAGAFLKHLFALEEQHRSKQCLSTGMEWGGDFDIDQAVGLVAAQPPKTASVGVQAKLCSCSDKVIVKTLRERSAVRMFETIQRGDLQNESTSDSEEVDQSDSDGVYQADSDDRSDSDYSDIEEMEEKVSYSGRKGKQKSKHKIAPKQKTKQRKDDQEMDTVSSPKTKWRKPDDGTESVSKPKKKRKRAKNAKEYIQEEGALFSCNICGAEFTREADINQHVNQHSGRSPYSSTDEPRYFCKECKRSFKNQEGMWRHKFTHTDWYKAAERMYVV
ncbi:zinc finger protein 165-like [Patiria miniata]|uniref:C2H2-type domain-containing protein n=1 Tax=Patiria miniata TaxID=46514 RepID=A0A914BAA9_PATMI|nr:zinc finger protein 165-like [Patiria miniata]XP_038072378.1 zinc finger protein 165-like [Patiria miniata]